MPLPDQGKLVGGVIAALVGGLFGWTQTAITGAALRRLARQHH
jgi:hypothetical protein